MSKQVNKTLIGAFILGAAALTVVGILALGGGNLLRESNRYVMYFSGSVKGLSVGAPVQLKGVPIGNVIDMNLVFISDNDSFINQVIFEVPENHVKIAGDLPNEGLQKKRITTETTVYKLIDNGLRGKLQLQSFVTGQLLVSLDFFPDTPVELMGFAQDLLEVPSLPSDMEALAKTFDAIDFQSIVESIKNAAQGIDALATSPELHEAVVAVNDTLKGYRQLAANLDRQVTRLSDETSATLADVRQLIATTDSQIPPMTTGITDTAAEVRKTVANLDQRLQPVMENIEATTVAARDAFQQAEVMLTNLTTLSEEDSALIYQIEETLAALRKVAGAVALLADYLGRHPEALLQGRQAVKENP